MSRLARLEDYALRYGDVARASEGKVQALLDDASALVLEAVTGSTASWVTGEEDPPRTVVMVVTGAAHRALRHADGVVREQLGQHAVTYRADDSWDIWLTDEEERIVRKAAGLSSARTVTLVSPFSGDEVAEVGAIYDNDLPL